MTDEFRDKILRLGDLFYAEAKLPGRFVIDSFMNSWHALLQMKVGAIWRADKHEELIGVLGGFFTPDLCDGEIIATEGFWFVHPEHRGSVGIKLFRTFEGWAREIGAKRLIMAHLATSMPDSLKRFYERENFQLMDVTYVKTL